MTSYLFRRVLQMIPTLFGVSVIVFLSLRAIPGDPAAILAGPNAEFEEVEALRERYGFDEPLLSQYGHYLSGLVRGDWGESLRTGEPVISGIADRFQPTLTLALAGVALAILVGVPLGIVAGANRGSAFDRVSMGASVLSICAPVFLVAILLQYLLSVKLPLFPSSGIGTWQHYVLPSIAVATFSVANIAKLTRAGIIDVLGRDFVTTLRAKGASELVVRYRHALRNASLPVITLVGLSFGRNVIGSIVTETVFAIPGLGRHLVLAISNRDYLVVQGVTLVIALSYLCVNLFTDIVYSVADPRVRLT